MAIVGSFRGSRTDHPPPSIAKVWKVECTTFTFILTHRWHTCTVLGLRQRLPPAANSVVVAGIYDRERTVVSSWSGVSVCIVQVASQFYSC